MARLRELVHRYRRRFLRKFSRPCPDNCDYAVERRNAVIGCKGCGSHNPQQCLLLDKFVCIETKEEIYERFRQEIREPQILLRDYPALVALFWVIGAFDSETIDEKVLGNVEKRI